MPDVAVVDHGDRVVVLALTEPTTAIPLVMEGPAAAIWHALDEAGTAVQVADRVAAEVGVPTAEVRRDVEEFLSVLADRGLAAIGGTPGSDLDDERGGHA